MENYAPLRENGTNIKRFYIALCFLAISVHPLNSACSVFESQENKSSKLNEIQLSEIKDYFLELPESYFGGISKEIRKRILQKGKNHEFELNIEGDCYRFTESDGGKQCVVSLRLFGQGADTALVAVTVDNQSNGAQLLNFVRFHGNKWYNLTSELLPLYNSEFLNFELPGFGRSIMVYDGRKRESSPIGYLVWSNNRFEVDWNENSSDFIKATAHPFHPQPNNVKDFFIYLPDQFIGWNREFRERLTRNSHTFIDISNDYLSHDASDNFENVTLRLFHDLENRKIAAVYSDREDFKGEGYCDFHFYVFENGKWKDQTKAFRPPSFDKRLMYILPREGNTIQVAERNGKNLHTLIWTGQKFEMSG